MRIYLLLILSLLLVGCRSSRETTVETRPAGTIKSETTAIPHTEGSEALTQRIVESINAQRLSQEYLTADTKVNLKGLGSKELSVNGRLKMKRNDCIRLSLRVFGIEVGLMEFTPEEVLIVDRYNKQYVRARYEEVAFLHEARIDFYALQALFWNEIFAPGIGSRTPEAKQFDASLEAGNVQLVSQKTGTLRYAFLTPIENARIERLTVTAARGDDPTQFVWKYDDFAKLGKRLFPTRMEMSLTSPKTSLGLTLRLSSLKEESGWPLRTTVSNKYQRRTVEEVLKGLHL